MSFDTNYKLWVATKKDLKTLLKKQNVLKSVETVDQKALQFQVFSEMYILYAELVNKLSKVYMHTLQVQKRAVVRDLMDATIKRYMEIKNDLKEIELSEYVYMDKALIKRKLTPSDVMIWRSPNFLYRRPPDLQNIHYGNKIFMTAEQKEEMAEVDHAKLCKALILIQAHERARVARIYKNQIKADKNKMKIKSRLDEYVFTFNPTKTGMAVAVKRTIYHEDFIKPTEECIAEFSEKEKESDEPQENPEEVKARQEKAAFVIQRTWARYKQKKVNKMITREKEYILGIKFKKKLRNPKIYEEDVIHMYKLELKKEVLDEEFKQLIEDERTRIFQERAPWIMEDISDHIRAWFKEFYDECGIFHPYPDEVKGGTVLVIKDETMLLEEFKPNVKNGVFNKEARKKQLAKEKAQKKKEKEKLKQEKAKMKKKIKDLRKKGIMPLGYDLRENKNIQKLEETIKNYSIDWRFIDEYLLKHHEPIKDWVTEDELAKAHKELRLVVDEAMRVEYELLQKALAMDQGRKYKKKKNKKKKAKGKKKKKKKKPVDLTEDRTLESLYMELKNQGFIENLPPKNFNDYIAEFNFVADDTRDEDHLTTLDPAIGDIKTVVEESILGLGEFAVTKPKSLLFIGPFQSGKKLLFNIIAAEVDALVINISPEKTLSLQEDDLEYFLHVVMKVAKAFQPTFLYIDNAHRLFWKKIPPDQEDSNPKLLMKALQKKILKQIKKDDRVMLLGTSDVPWSAKGKFKRLFQKVILIPKTDYGTAFLMWLNLLEENIPENIEDYQITALTKVLNKYTTGDVTENVKNTLNCQRKMTLNARKLDPHEFLEYYINRQEPKLPLPEKMINKYNKWFKRSNKLAKKRAKFFRAKMAKKKKR